MSRAIHEIKKQPFLRVGDEHLSASARDRVRTQIAKDLRSGTPLKPGRCHGCGVDSAGHLDDITPCQMTVCQPCAKRMYEISGKLPQDRNYHRTTRPAFCEYCMQKTLLTFLVNPYFCIKCLTGQHKKHKYKGKRNKKYTKRLKERDLKSRTVK